MKMSAGSDYVATLPGAPFPDGKVFDPLGLSDGADPADIKRWREAEIKHGRVAMLATVGVLVAEVRNRMNSRRSRLVPADELPAIGGLIMNIEDFFTLSHVPTHVASSIDSTPGGQSRLVFQHPSPSRGHVQDSNCRTVPLLHVILVLMFHVGDSDRLH